MGRQTDRNSGKGGEREREGMQYIILSTGDVHGWGLPVDEGKGKVLCTVSAMSDK